MLGEGPHHDLGKGCFTLHAGFLFLLPPPIYSTEDCRKGGLGLRRGNAEDFSKKLGERRRAKEHE